MITVAEYNAMLDARFPSGAGNLFLSAHTAFSATGANLTGVKTSANFSAAANRVKALSATVGIAIGAGVTVSWIGIWDSTQAVFKGMYPNGGVDRSFQVGVTPNTLLCEGSGFANNDKITFHNDTPPTGLTEGNHYFVVGVTAGDPDTFQVSLTLSGPAIDITGQPASGCVVSKVVEELFASGGTFNVLTFPISI
jgi:hypothetical protein